MIRRFFACFLLWLSASPPTLAAPAILVIGDSLSAAYGIETKQGWVELLQQKLRRQGYPHEVINASISGETSSGGAARIEAELKRHSPAIVIIALGANDALRGLSLAALKMNLAQMIEKSETHGAAVLLIGMQLPPNYGPRFNHRLASTYAELAARYDTALLPFLLQGIGENLALFQADGLHPGAEAQATIMSNVWAQLVTLIKHR